jgi:hypothetical protein
MTDLRRQRVLVVTDTAEPSPSLLEAIRHRAEQGNAQVRLVVLNPARAELNLFHPERHDKATEAEHVLHAAMPQLTDAAGGRVIGSVSVRHDPMDAIEEVLFSEPIDEVLIDVPAHHLASMLHQDLERRLRHHHVTVATIRHGEPGHPGAHAPPLR